MTNPVQMSTRDMRTCRHPAVMSLLELAADMLVHEPAVERLTLWIEQRVAREIRQRMVDLNTPPPWWLA